MQRVDCCSRVRCTRKLRCAAASVLSTRLNRKCSTHPDELPRAGRLVPVSSRPLPPRTFDGCCTQVEHFVTLQWTLDDTRYIRYVVEDWWQRGRFPYTSFQRHKCAHKKHTRTCDPSFGGTQPRRRASASRWSATLLDKPRLRPVGDNGRK